MHKYFARDYPRPFVLFGPWPWYLGPAALLAVGFVLPAYAPFLLF